MRRDSEPATILIVEDDPVLGQVLAQVLTHEQQTAVHVPSTSQAFRLVNNRWPRLVLLDTGLRDGTAIKLALAIRVAEPGLPIIFLTAHPRHTSAFPVWVDRVVTKSVDLLELRRTIDAVLEQARANSDSDQVETSRLPSVAGSRRRGSPANR